MGRMGEVGIRRLPRVLYFLPAGLVTLGFVASAVYAAEADLLAIDASNASAPATLTPSASKKADALALYATGLFEEDTEGPEKAIERFREVLTLDPAYTDLAVKVAYDYLRRGDTVKATSVLKDTSKAAPKDPVPLMVLSAIYLKHLNKPDLAVTYAQRAIEVAPSSFAAREALWEIYTNRGDSTKADLVLDRAARAKNTDPAYWASLAELIGRRSFREGTPLSEKQFSRISEFTEKAASLGKDDPILLARCGDIYVLSRQVDKAIPHYEQAYNKKASLPQLRHKLAACYFEAGRSADATPLYEEIVKLNPLDIEGYDALGKIYMREGNDSKALANARQALLIEPQNLNRHLLVIDLLFRQKDFPGAASALAEARRVFPRTPRLSYFHGLALSQAKRHDEAIRVFEQALIEAGNSQPDLLGPDFYFDYGAAAEQAGLVVKAAELFKKSIQLDPNNAARAYNYLGYMWVDRGENLDEAEQLIQRAVEMEPANGAYLDSLGWLYYKQGRYEEALKTLLHAAECLPEPDAVVFDHVADAYHKLGKTTEAVLYWQKARRLAPDDAKIAEKLDKVSKAVVKKPVDETKSSLPTAE